MAAAQSPGLRMMIYGDAPYHYLPSPAWRRQRRLPAMTVGMIPGGQDEKLPPQLTGTLAAGDPYTTPPAPSRQVPPARPRSVGVRPTTAPG
ncbi:MAG: hypothetical protein GX358_09880 [candidate division WS1 bacterium]|mgnify:FL=1|nr:hypothetical protein [candidate division WS1 bacterium]